MRFSKVVIKLLIVGGLFSACNPVKRVPDGKFLLTRNEIKTDTSIIQNERFEKYLKQKPNRKILGLFRFHLWLYNLSKSENDSAWLKKIGEAPVLLDTELTVRSKHQLELFLYKNGFFNATVTDTIRLHKKKAVVEYYVKYNEAYTYRNLDYSTQDTGIIYLMNYYKSNSLLIPGERYNEDDIEKERVRITSDLKDRAYYFFNKNYITFQVDSSLGTHQTDINLYINRENENVSNSLPTVMPVTDHQTYKLRNIYIQTDHNPKDPTMSIPRDTTFYNGYYILSVGHERVLKDDFLVRNLFIKSGDAYLQRDLDFTYRRLQELNVFKFINIYFKEVPRDENQTEYLLDLQIQLTPMNKLDFTIETEVTNTGSNIGLDGSFGYRNKNTFKGAEVLSLKIKGGLEAIPNTKTAPEDNKFYVFNTWNIGPEANFELKKFFLPGFIEKKTSRYANPKTNFNLGYNKQNSPDYERAITNFGFNYSFSPTKKQRWIVYLLDINSVKVDLSPEFAQELADLNDPQLSYAYATHFITATRVSWSTTNKNLITDRNFVYFRANYEIAHNVLHLSKLPSLYKKVEFDFTHNHRINKFNNLVSHLTMGIGVPYDGQPALPFEKSFFAGGANSMRAWYARTLGPGSYKDPINIEQSGDIKIETNFEYRSEIVELSNGMKLEGAAFVDIGNIWTLNNDDSREGSKISSNAIKELGIGPGLGLRFNFSFFIFRLDFAVKVRDPSLDEDKRWVYQYQKFVIGDITPNLGIGYPF